MNKNIKKISLTALISLLCISNISYSSETNEETVNLMLSGEEQIFEENVSEKIKANKETLDKAQQAFDNKDFTTVINLLTGYINSKPNKYEPYKLRGDAYYELRQYSLAEKDYQTAVNIKLSGDKFMTGTKYVSAIVLGADKNEQLQNTELGNLYGRLMYAQKAQNNPAWSTSYENAIKYNSHIYLPEPKKSEINLINCPQKYGKPLNPSGIDESLYGAINEIEKENFNEALYKIQNVTSSYPNYYLGYYVTGVALSGLEKYDDAIHSFEKSISLNPYDFESYASLGQLYFDKAETSFSSEDAKKSIEYFNKAIKLNNNCPTYHFYIGMNNLQMGNFQLAIDNFEKAIKFNPNDYNSKYYKSIAQFNKGDYQSVVNDTSSLLLKHVSNYNSVLYLRALAYYKMKNYDEALSDLNLIQNNIQDIYNADIKVVTERDKALESYIYYLKSEIAHSQGEGAASDYEKAMQNPIISQLVKAENAILPYEKILDNEKISLEDYKKFEEFYSTGLEKLLQSGIVISSKDVENQYDYIRTTFEDLGITFTYLNPDYKLTSIKDYPYKKYSSKLSTEDLKTLSQQTSPELQKSVPTVVTPILKQSTDQRDLILPESSSLAQMLATNELETRVKAAEETKKIQENLTNEGSKEIVSESNFKPETPDAEKAKAPSNIASGEPFVFRDKESPLVEKQNSQKLKTILEEEKNIQSDEKGNIKISAKEIQQTPDIEIKYNKQPQNQVIEQTKKVENTVANIKDETTKTDNQSAIKASETVETKPIHKISEKHADVDLSQYGMQTKHTSFTYDNNDIVVLDTSNPNKTAEEPTQQKVEKENITTKLTTTENTKDSAPQVVLPEEREKQIKETEVPVAVVPEIKNPTPSIRPKADVEENIQTAAEKQLLTEANKIDNISKKSDEIIKEIQPEQEKTEDIKELAKAQKQEAKALAKEQAEKLKEERDKAKAQAEAQKQEAKALAKEQAKKLKEERDKAKAQAKAQKQEAKALAKEQAKKLKEERDKAKAQVKAQKQEAKTLAKEQAKKLKEERDKAKAQAKAQKQEAKALAKEQAKKLKEESDKAKAQVKESKKVVEETKDNDKEIKVNSKKLDLKGLFKWGIKQPE